MRTSNNSPYWDARSFASLVLVATLNVLILCNVWPSTNCSTFSYTHSHNRRLQIAIFTGPIRCADRQPRHQSLMAAFPGIASAENQHYDRTISRQSCQAPE